MTRMDEHRHRDPWLRVRHELSAGRRAWLMTISFILPVALWCVVSYVPWFHADNRVLITADRRDPTLAKYIPGDRVAKSFWADFVKEIRDSNEKTRAEWAAGDLKGSTRANRRVIRKLQPVAEANGWLRNVDVNDAGALDQALFELWGELAEEARFATALPLTDENMRVVRDNWTHMKTFAPYDNARYVDVPLLQLVPEGKSATPVYLPAPHECFTAMVRDFTTAPANNEPWMHQRLLSSLKVVFGGFLLACLVGVPLGLLCGTYDAVAKLFEPFTDFFRYMPAPTFALLLVAIFGVKGAPKIALVFIGTFPHMVLMIGNTTRLIDRALLEAAQTLGAKNRILVLKVIIPGILPKLYNDLRVLLGWAWTWLVIAELIGEKSGLTGFIDTQGTRRNFDRVFPVIIMIGVIGFLTDQILQIVARKLFPWEYTEQRRGVFGYLWLLLLLVRYKLRVAFQLAEPDETPTGDQRHVRAA